MSLTTGTSHSVEQVPSTVAGAELERGSFDSLAGWHEDDHAAALTAFVMGCQRADVLRQGLEPPAALARACADALALIAPDRQQARLFFENRFVPLTIRPESQRGFLTGYFEPEFRGSPVRTDAFPVPLFGRPDDLVTLGQGESAAGVPTGFQAARRAADGALGPYPTRREIEEGAVPGLPVVAWLADEVDRFVMQVQGSARLRFPDGLVLRVAYAGRNGHPYTSLGRLLSQTEAIPPAEITMDRLVARLKGDPGWARRFMWNNASFVFFRAAAELAPGSGPIGGAGLPLTAHRSVAADRAIWPYGLPIWLDGTIPTADRGQTESLRRLAVIQDTGSAIVGPARFDLYFGSGAEAGFVAGLTRHGVDATILWPRADLP